MKKIIKPVLLVLLAVIVISGIEFAVGLNKLDDVNNNIIVYNQQEYERLENWELNTDDFSEVSAYVGSDEEQNKEPNSTVKLINNSNEIFIVAEIHGVESVYCKKDAKPAPSYEPTDIVSAEVKVEGRYITLSDEMKNKLFGYLKSNSDDLPTLEREPEYQEISDIRVCYAQYPYVLRNIGTLAKYQNNIIFIPSGQKRNMVFGDEFIPIPFDPLFEIGESVK